VDVLLAVGGRAHLRRCDTRTGGEAGGV
jgi:hypothetical protein